MIAEAIATLEDRSQRPLFLITGMINTKDPVGYFQAFTGMARHVYTVPIRSSGAGIPHDELALAANEAGLSAEPVHSVENALKILRDSWDKSEPGAANPDWRIAVSGWRRSFGQWHAAAIELCFYANSGRKTGSHFSWNCSRALRNKKPGSDRAFVVRMT